LCGLLAVGVVSMMVLHISVKSLDGDRKKVAEGEEHLLENP